MKKFFITLAILFTASLPVFSANWVLMSNDMQIYVDTSSFTLYPSNFSNRQNDLLYSYWIKKIYTNSEYEREMSTISGVAFSYVKIQYIINCSRKEIALKSYSSFDANDRPVIMPSYAHATYSDYALEWNSISPESYTEDIYNTVCVKRY